MALKEKQKMSVHKRYSMCVQFLLINTVLPKIISTDYFPNITSKKTIFAYKYYLNYANTPKVCIEHICMAQLPILQAASESKAIEDDADCCNLSHRTGTVPHNSTVV